MTIKHKQILEAFYYTKFPIMLLVELSATRPYDKDFYYILEQVIYVHEFLCQEAELKSEVNK
jgi:hypothetical protein